jgi:hypothetical protein
MMVAAFVNMKDLNDRFDTASAAHNQMMKEKFDQLSRGRPDSTEANMISKETCFTLHVRAPPPKKIAKYEYETFVFDKPFKSGCWW